MLSLFALLGGGHLYLPQASEGRSSLVAQMVKHLLAMRETGVRFLGQEGPLEKEMAIHSIFGRNDAKAETPILWPPHVKS